MGNKDLRECKPWRSPLQILAPRKASILSETWLIFQLCNDMEFSTHILGQIMKSDNFCQSTCRNRVLFFNDSKKHSSQNITTKLWKSTAAQFLGLEYPSVWTKVCVTNADEKFMWNPAEHIGLTEHRTCPCHCKKILILTKIKYEKWEKFETPLLKSFGTRSARELWLVSSTTLWCDLRCTAHAFNVMWISWSHFQRMSAASLNGTLKTSITFTVFPKVFTWKNCLVLVYS